MENKPSPIQTGVIEQREANTRSSVVQWAVIPAGGTWGISHYGNRFYFQQATSIILARTEHTVDRPYKKGQGEQFPDELRFKRLEISNPNPFDIYVQVWVGFGEFLDSTFEVVDGFTKCFGVPLPSQQIAALSEVYLSGNPTGQQLQRKAVVISNMDLANVLLVMEADNSGVGTVPTNVIFPLTSIILPVSGPIVVRNNTASPIVTYIGEIFYVLAH